MFRKLRNAAAILCGSALVSVAVLSSCQSAATTDSDAQNITAESEGKSGSQIHKEEDGQSDGEEPDRSSESREETTEETVTETEEESPSETVTETESESPSETETETESESPSESETETEEEKIIGLRKFFEHKLVVNADKVSLYLNVRAEPNDDSDVLSVLYPNDIATYIRKTGNWYEIEREGYTGYVNASYVFADGKAYDLMVHSVAYAAMVKDYESYLYAVPDTSTEIILCAHKSDKFRVKSISGGFYEVQVVSDIYDTLFMPMDNAILYYLFLGLGNSNELGEYEEEFFGTLEIEANLERSRELIAEYAEDLQEYQEYVASSEAESLAAEQEYIEASKKAEADYIAASQQNEAAYQEYLAASRQAAASSAEAARQQASAAASAAQQSGEAQYLGNFYITAYCHCPVCCGVWGSNDPNYQAHGSSGMLLQKGYSVAVNLSQIPYGTRLLINGKEYMAADTGVGQNMIDIYMQTHDAALASGAYYADVYVLP